jgi:hypothetical protein
MGRLGLGHVSDLVEALARLEQVARQTGSADIDSETVDEATAFDDGAAGLPEGTAFARAGLLPSLSGEAKRAVLGFDPAHVTSVCHQGAGDIGQPTDLPCGDLPSGQCVGEIERRQNADRALRTRCDDEGMRRSVLVEERGRPLERLIFVRSGAVLASAAAVVAGGPSSAAASSTSVTIPCSGTTTH